MALGGDRGVGHHRRGGGESRSPGARRPQRAGGDRPGDRNLAHREADPHALCAPGQRSPRRDLCRSRSGGFGRCPRHARQRGRRAGARTLRPGVDLLPAGQRFALRGPRRADHLPCGGGLRAGERRPPQHVRGPHPGRRTQRPTPRHHPVPSGGDPSDPGRRRARGRPLRSPAHRPSAAGLRHPRHQCPGQQGGGDPAAAADHGGPGAGVRGAGGRPAAAGGRVSRHLGSRWR